MLFFVLIICYVCYVMMLYWLGSKAIPHTAKRPLKRKSPTNISFQTSFSPKVFLCMQQHIKSLGQMSPDFISSVWVINLWS